MAKDVIRKEDALEYHEHSIPGKIAVIPTKGTQSQRDLALAYSPGVAYPCLEIANNKEDVYKYTTKGNLVAVISNGTAVLGLGNIGPEASKPVMEGKGVLFKIFAGIDVFDIEVDSTDVDEFVRIVKSLEPTFGGINLEDIKAPDCFEIETRLKQEMNIPVMHDDQHGTAIISGAALLNALELVNKKAEEVKVVVSGAGASAISCVKIFIELGVSKSNIIVCDSRGVIHTERENLTGHKAEFAANTDARTLEEAMQGADVFLGLSMGNVVSPEMLQTMGDNPIVFALANPDPEIPYEIAMSSREDLIMATGRSDHPNQVNNVLGFPFIFRGALDVRATEINESMKLAAVKAIADLAKQPVPDAVTKAYNLESLNFGTSYIIPKPLDPRLLTSVAPAVAKAAMETGVAQQPITDWDEYKNELQQRMGQEDNIIRRMNNKARQTRKRIVFAEADNPKVLKAIRVAKDEGIVDPILLGNRERIEAMIEALELKGMSKVTIIDPRAKEFAAQKEEYAKAYYEKRQRKGIIMEEAHDLMSKRNYFGAMMVEKGEADALLSGVTRNYAGTIRPALEVIGARDGLVASMYLMLTKKGPLFFADTTINENPSAEELAKITEMVAKTVKRDFDLEPRVALLSHSNFGGSKHPDSTRMRQVRQLLKEKMPNLKVDGEIQANFAVNKEALTNVFPFSELAGEGANIFIFPDLTSANISYKLLQEMGEVEAIGPIMLGMKKTVHILQLGSEEREILHMIALSNVDAQRFDQQ
ncbi:NADP-dependent malic enzyme [Algivirga pacifica]|uniref:NADP-dependent malic enzyme n=1 Tax=Algivirga pacifica TaxID=1162670 RepID=A0ABP9DAE6_9BACT